MNNIKEISKIYNEAYILRSEIIKICKLIFDDLINYNYSNLLIFHKK